MTTIASIIDHAALHPAMTDAELTAEVLIAKKYQTASICIKPYAVKLAAELLKDTDVKVCTVIGFPHGNSATEIKIAETKLAIADGAQEIDMVINIGKANSEDWDYVQNEITALTDICHRAGKIIKVIFETTFLKDNDVKLQLCKICTLAGCDFVKTSTGFDYIKLANGTIATIGATIEDCRLMKESISETMQVKASGGIRSIEDIKRLQSIGVTRFGTSSTVQILEG